MWSLKAWRRRRILRATPVSAELWRSVVQSLPILAGLEEDQLSRLRDRAILFLHDKRLTCLPPLELDDAQRLRLAVLAELPLLALDDLDWYQGFHEILLYPGDFIGQHRFRDASGIEHEEHVALSGEAWLQGPVILAWSGVQHSGDWDGYNLVIHELAHKLDMLNGDANGLPPLHRDMAVADWAEAMQQAYDRLNAELERNPDAHTEIDPYAAENPGEFFAVISEYFFSAPVELYQAFPAVYQQLRLFYRQDTLARFNALPGRPAHDVNDHA